MFDAETYRGDLSAQTGLGVFMFFYIMGLQSLLARESQKMNGKKVLGIIKREMKKTIGSRRSSSSVLLLV